MAKPDLTLQDVLAAVPEDFWESTGVGGDKGKVLRAVRKCGTGAFGYTVLLCQECAHIQHVPRGCHNRNCPTCLSSAGREWVAEQEARLLPTPYFHVVMTLPCPLRELALVNAAPMYDLLMRAAKETMLDFYRGREPAGGIPSLLQVLHTWNQRLDHHPHVHMLVSGGWYDNDRHEWIPCPNPKFLVPGRVLAEAFRDRFLDRLQALRSRGTLSFEHHSVSHLVTVAGWQALIDDLRAQNWNVHIKPPFAGPRQVVRYLARYTHRTALSNRRLVRLDNGRVTFTYSDRKAGEQRTRTLPVESFVALYAIHIPPKGFRRIRACGLLAPNRQELFAQASRAAFAHPAAATLEDVPEGLPRERPEPETCACCGSEDLMCIAYVLPVFGEPGSFYTIPALQPRPPPVQGGAATSAGVVA